MDPAEAARSARRDFRRQLRKNKARLDKAREKAPSWSRLSSNPPGTRPGPKHCGRSRRPSTARTRRTGRVPDAEAIFDAEDRAFLEIGAEADDDRVRALTGGHETSIVAPGHSPPLWWPAKVDVGCLEEDAGDARVSASCSPRTAIAPPPPRNVVHEGVDAVFGPSRQIAPGHQILRASSP